jgi:Uncharacterized protein conserved in bacteria
MDYLKMVEQFHKTFDQVVLPEPAIPTGERCALRLGLIQEELDELAKAYNDGDVTEMADALADLMYVVAGTVLESGLKDKFNQLFAEVHRSNMSKACSSYAEAQATVEGYGIPCDIRPKTLDGKDVFLVFRKSDNKLLKSINYSPADIKSAITCTRCVCELTCPNCNGWHESL